MTALNQLAALLSLVKATAMYAEADTYSPLSEGRRECNRDARHYAVDYECRLEAHTSQPRRPVKVADLRRVFKSLDSENTVSSAGKDLDGRDMWNVSIKYGAGAAGAIMQELGMVELDRDIRGSQHDWVNAYLVRFA